MSESDRDEHDDALFGSHVLLDDGAGPALPLDSREQRALVAEVVRRARTNKPAAVIRFPRTAVVAVGIATLATGAAAFSVGAGYWTQGHQTTSSPAPSNPTVERASNRRDSPAPPANDPESHEMESELPAQADATRADPKPPETAAPRRSVRPKRVASTRPAPSSEPEAADDLRRANELRRYERYHEALSTYLRIIDDYPESLQAQAARVAAASLKLEQLGDAEGAGELYETASRRGSTLSAEACFGLAESHRARGDRTAERQALRRFLQQHADSPLAMPARRRLELLEAEDEARE